MALPAALLLVALLVNSGQVCQAQPPNNYPPEELVRPAKESGTGQLPIRGIMFLDASGNPVYWPDMTYERILELEAGPQNQTRNYIIDSVLIDGKVAGESALLDVRIKVRINATGTESIEVPLGLQNFHRITEPTFAGDNKQANRLAVAIASEAGPHTLVASVPKDSVIELRMKMSARVDRTAGSALEFQLPAAPAVVNVQTETPDAIGKIIDRDAEVIQSSQGNKGNVKFRVESNGGRFTLQWSPPQTEQTVSLLESDTTVSVRWNSPQDPIIETVRMTVRDSNSPIKAIDLQLPAGGKLLERPKLLPNSSAAADATGTPLESAAAGPNQPELLRVTIPTAQQSQLLTVEFRLELPSNPASTGTPHELAAPVIPNALRNQGTLEIETSSDYRLRWQQSVYVKNFAVARSDEATDVRRYAFEYVRGAFRLPIWLDATRREFRVTSHCDVDMRDTYAELTMQILSTGNSNSGQLISVDLADWQLPKIENGRTGAPVSWYESDGLLHIDLPYNGMEESSPVTIRTRRTLGDSAEAPSTVTQPETLDAQLIRMTLPRVVNPGEVQTPITLQESTARITSLGRRALVVDLEQSKNLERVSSTQTDNDTSKRFTVVPPEAAATVVGQMVPQPPRLILSGDASVQLLPGQADALTLESIVQWNLISKTDLEGRLRIAVAADQAMIDAYQAGTVDQLLQERRWQVSLDNAPAPIRFMGLTKQTSATETPALSPNQTAAPPLPINPVESPPDASADESTGSANKPDEQAASAPANVTTDRDTDLPKPANGGPDGAEDGPDSATGGPDSSSAPQRSGQGDSVDDDANQVSNGTDSSKTTAQPIANPRPAQVGDWVILEIISDTLSTQAADIRFRFLTPVDAASNSTTLTTSIALPFPTVQDVTLEGDMKIQLRGSQQYEIRGNFDSLNNEIQLETLPQQPVVLQLLPKASSSNELRIGKTLIRTAINEVAQHDQIIAQLSGSGELRIELRDSDGTKTDVLINGQTVPTQISGDELVVNIPAGQENQIVDIRTWSSRPQQTLWDPIRPLAFLGHGQEEKYWQVSVPQNQHLIHAAASSERMMTWAFDRYHMARRPLISESILASQIISSTGAVPELTEMPKGNRYLFAAIDDRPMQMRTASRTLVWLVVASLILFATSILTYFPATRNPLALILMLVMLGGIIVAAPDAGVMASQVALLSILVAVIMLAIRHLTNPRASRVLISTIDDRKEGSSLHARKLDLRSASSVAITHSVGVDDIASAQSEATP